MVDLNMAYYFAIVTARSRELAHDQYERTFNFVGDVSHGKIHIR
jgi:hypothetical protein